MLRDESLIGNTVSEETRVTATLGSEIITGQRWDHCCCLRTSVTYFVVIDGQRRVRGHLYDDAECRCWWSPQSGVQLLARHGVCRLPSHRAGLRPPSPSPSSHAGNRSRDSPAWEQKNNNSELKSFQNKENMLTSNLSPIIWWKSWHESHSSSYYHNTKPGHFSLAPGQTRKERTCEWHSDLVLAPLFISCYFWISFPVQVFEKLIEFLSALTDSCFDLRL